MDKIIVRGGNKLVGNIRVSGAKNAVLPIIAASILAKRGSCIIHDTPGYDDVVVMSRLLQGLGLSITYENETLCVDACQIHSCEPSFEWVKMLRASFLVMGPLLARTGQAKISLPGGCAIGTRPIDQHLKGFEAMGASIQIGQGCIEAKVKGRLKGSKIYLDVPSVGATENIMMAATLAEGTTIIENVAKEPEIVDLANFLNAMGAKVRGAGTEVIRIEGVTELSGCEHFVIPDRIEAGTFMVAAAITGGHLLIENAIEDHLKPVISKLQEIGVDIVNDSAGLQVAARRKLSSVDIKTLPYPGFPTDMQAQMMALMLKTEGTSLITETVFENRFMHVEALNILGGRIKVEGRTALVTGNNQLTGGKVCATDLRAGASLVLAALVSEGETEITGTHHIDRGYVNLVEKLMNTGADVSRRSVAAAVRKEAKARILTPQPSWI